MKNITLLFFSKLYCLIHPISTYKIVQGILIIITIYTKTQEIDLINNKDQDAPQEMNTLISFFRLCFVINAITLNQVIILIVAFFVIHLVYAVFVIYFVFIQQKNNLVQQFLFHFTFNYLGTLYNPIIYCGFLFISNATVCNDSDLCTGSNFIILSIISFTNIVFAILIGFIHIYFGRSDTLMGDNNILVSEHSLILRGGDQILLFAVILLKAFNSVQYLRLALLSFKWLYNILRQFNKTNCQIYAMIDYISIITIYCIIIKVTFYDYFLCLILLIPTFYQLMEYISIRYILQKDQQNLNTLQHIEQAVLQQSKQQSKLQLLIALRNHNCNKCKHFYQIAECILKRIANKQQTNNSQIVTIFCEYMGNHAPLKALIRLLLLKQQNVYYLCVSDNLANELAKRSQQFQKEIDDKNTLKNRTEHTNSLEVETVFKTSQSATEFFPLIIDALNAKINFWTKLINGYQVIDECLIEAEKTSKKMLLCKQKISNKFDLITNKLKNQATTDIISLRIIQIYYCGIYTNQFLAYQIEKTIDDILKSERYKQDESLDNIQIVQDRLIILKSSLVNKRGELFNLNYKQLSKFLNETEERSKIIKHCNQLMPSFLASIHDQLIENYVQNGYCKLMVHGESSFYQNIQGYIEPCSINLFNFYDGMDDFILNMIVTKEQSNGEIILFGIDGKILGITHQFFEEAIQLNSNFSKTQTTGRTGELLNNQRITDFLEKDPLIQFYIPNIIQQIEDLKNQIQNSSNYLLNNQKSCWTLPNNHIECLNNSKFILQGFKKKSQGSSNYRSYKSQTYSKYSNYSNPTIQELYDEKDIDKDILPKITVDEIPLMILHPDMINPLKQLIDFIDLNKQTIQLTLFYSIQFKTIRYKNNQYGYFQISIKEYKFMSSQIINQTQYHLSSNEQTPKTIKSTHFLLETTDLNTSRQSQQIDIKSENPNQEIELIQEIKQMNNFLNKEADQSLDQSNVKLLQLNYSNRSNQIETNRQNQPLFAKVQINNRQDEISQIEREMNQIQDYQFDQYDENDLEIIKQKQESNTQSVQKKSNILEKFKQTQMQKIEAAGDFASNPSRTSTNSTSKESILVIQQLYIKTDLILPLKKISILLILICFGILICEILNIFLIENNLSEQTTQIVNLIKPQNIIYYYTSVLYQMWTNQLEYLEIINLSPFQKQRNIETVAGMMNYGQQYIQDFNIDVPLTAISLGINQFLFKIVIENKTINQQNTSISNIYPILYEYTYDNYYFNLNSTTPYYSALWSIGIIRQNFFRLLEVHNTLIVTITDDTIAKQNEVTNQFLMNMLIELFTILFIIGIQMKYWLFIDHIKKSIVFLVSRLNEQQTIDQIQKLNSIKDCLQDQTSNVWKLCNFGDLIFEKNDKKNKKIILKQNESIITSSSKQNNYKSSTALYSRIQKTYYLNRINVFLTFFITLIWTVFLVTGYVVHMQNNSDFQPSLTATLKYGQFRLNMDSVGILAGFIKTEQLIENNNILLINQTYSTSLLKQFKNNLSPIINEVAQVILENANANGKKSRFDNILNYDICDFTEWDEMKSCDMTKQDLEYYESDQIRAIVQNGILGYTAALVKYLNQDFDYEFENLAYDSIKNNQYSITQQPFENFVLSYYCDIQNTMLEFLNLFQIDNQDIANNINSIMRIYYIGVGICLFIFLILLFIIWVYKSQQNIILLRQILVLIPQDLILNANIRSQAREIHNWLY